MSTLNIAREVLEPKVAVIANADVIFSEAKRAIIKASATAANAHRLRHRDWMRYRLRTGAGSNCHRVPAALSADREADFGFVLAEAFCRALGPSLRIERISHRGGGFSRPQDL
jgi:hypothetical protein